MVNAAFKYVPPTSSNDHLYLPFFYESIPLSCYTVTAYLSMSAALLLISSMVSTGGSFLINRSRSLAALFIWIERTRGIYTIE